ncbi:MAG: hypothetical protein WCR59_11775, partial [Planctomycetota bacterium]
MSELHLDAAIESLFARGVGVNVGAPQIAYREALAGPAEVDFTLNEQISGTRQFAHVKLRVEENGT